MPDINKPRTIGELRASGYRVLSVKEEMRKNLIQKMRAGETLFPLLVGYEETVIPQVENAVLSGQDIVLLGERGQAKTRLARSLATLLDEEAPAIAGCEINDSPFEPICQRCQRLVEDEGDDVSIAWIHRDRRYGEKLATPDITIADLIGEVDPIKVAEGRYLSDETTIHFGLIPRTNRGIFAINELPDLAERIQVGLLNILEERDVQVRGYMLRLPLDLFVVASANPEDYTSRGRIITPLKDRLGSQIRTHYPHTLEHEISIMRQERMRFEDVPGGPHLDEPPYMLEVVAELSHLARRAPEISQRSGVSVRVSVANLETLLANAYRRAVRLREPEAAPRISDLVALLPSTTGKIELETIGDNVPEERVVERLVNRSVLAVFGRRVQADSLDDVVSAFDAGLTVETGELVPSRSYVRWAREVPGLGEAASSLGATDSPASIASAVEFVLEGLHLQRRLNKERHAAVGGGGTYRR